MREAVGLAATTRISAWHLECPFIVNCTGTVLLEKLAVSAPVMDAKLRCVNRHLIPSAQQIQLEWAFCRGMFGHYA
jgi:hypothetical protein